MDRSHPKTAPASAARRHNSETATVLRIALALVFALMALTGCAPGPADWRWSDTLTSEDLDVVHASALEWCSATEGACCPDLGTIDVRAVTACECHDRVGSDCVGYWTPNTRTLGLVLTDLVTYRHLRSVVLHELGHSCGLEHSDSPGDVMHSPCTADSLSDADVAAALQR